MVARRFFAAYSLYSPNDKGVRVNQIDPALDLESSGGIERAPGRGPQLRSPLHGSTFFLSRAERRDRKLGMWYIRESSRESDHAAPCSAAPTKAPGAWSRGGLVIALRPNRPLVRMTAKGFRGRFPFASSRLKPFFGRWLSSITRPRILTPPVGEARAEP